MAKLTNASSAAPSILETVQFLSLELWPLEVHSCPQQAQSTGQRIERDRWWRWRWPSFSDIRQIENLLRAVAIHPGPSTSGLGHFQPSPLPAEALLFISVTEGRFQCRCRVVDELVVCGWGRPAASCPISGETRGQPMGERSRRPSSSTLSRGKEGGGRERLDNTDDLYEGVGSGVRTVQYRSYCTVLYSCGCRNRLRKQDLAELSPRLMGTAWHFPSLSETDL